MRAHTSFLRWEDQSAQILGDICAADAAVSDFDADVVRSAGSSEC